MWGCMVDRFFLRAFTFAGIGLLLWVIYLLKPVVIPFFIAFLFAYLLNPLVEKLCQWKCSRGFSISLVFLGIIILLTWAFWYVIPLLWKQMVFVRDNIPTWIAWVNQVLLPWISKTFKVDEMILDTEQISTVVLSYIQTNYNADSIQTALLQLVKQGLNVIQIGGSAILIPIITFYVLIDWHQMLHRLRSLVPVRFEQKTLQIVSECDSVLKAFVKGQLLVMFLLGVIYATGLQLIGLEVGLMIGLLAGLASIIPYAGFALGIIAALIASFFQFGLDWVQLVLVCVVFMVGQLCEGYILQPLLLGDKIGLSPVAVIFSVLAGAQLAGFVGMLLALPVAALIVVMLHHIKEYYQQSEWFNRQYVTIPETTPFPTTEAELEKMEDEIDNPSSSTPVQALTKENQEEKE